MDYDQDMEWETDPDDARELHAAMQSEATAYDRLAAASDWDLLFGEGY